MKESLDVNPLSTILKKFTTIRYSSIKLLKLPNRTKNRNINHLPLISQPLQGRTTVTYVDLEVTADYQLVTIVAAINPGISGSPNDGHPSFQCARHSGSNHTGVKYKHPSFEDRIYDLVAGCHSSKRIILKVDPWSLTVSSTLGVVFQSCFRLMALR